MLFNYFLRGEKKWHKKKLCHVMTKTAIAKGSSTVQALRAQALEQGRPGFKSQNLHDLGQGT